MPSALANARGRPLRTGASRIRARAPGQQSIPSRCRWHVRSTQSPPEKCQKDAMGPVSSRCRCNPCSGSSGHWLAMQKLDRCAARCRSLLRVRSPQSRRELPARSSHRAADIHPAHIRGNQAESVSPDRQHRQRGLCIADSPPSGTSSLLRFPSEEWRYSWLAIWAPYSAFTLMFFGFLNGRNAMKSA